MTILLDFSGGGWTQEDSSICTPCSRKRGDENQIKEAFINGGRGHPPSHLKFFLLVFSKLKEDIK